MAVKLGASQNSLSRLAICQGRIERSMLGLTFKDKIQNTEIRGRTNLTKVTVRVTEMVVGRSSDEGQMQ